MQAPGDEFQGVQPGIAPGFEALVLLARYADAEPYIVLFQSQLYPAAFELIQARLHNENMLVAILQKGNKQIAIEGPA